MQAGWKFRDFWFPGLVSMHKFCRRKTDVIQLLPLLFQLLAKFHAIS